MTKTRAIVLLVWTVLELLICITIVLMFSYPQKLMIEKKFGDPTDPAYRDVAEELSISFGWNQMICSMSEQFQEDKNYNKVMMRFKNSFAGKPFVIEERFFVVNLCEVYYRENAGHLKTCACWDDPWLKVVTGVISFTIFVTVVDFVVTLYMGIVNKRAFGYEVSMGIVWCIIGIAWIICVVLCSLMFNAKWPYKVRSIYNYMDGDFIYAVPTTYYIGLSCVCVMVVMSFMHIWRFFENGLTEIPAVAQSPVVMVQLPPRPQVYLQPSPVMYMQPRQMVYAPASPQGYDARVTPPVGVPQQMATTSKSSDQQDRPATYSPPSSPDKVSEKGRLSSGSLKKSKVVKASFLDIITIPEKKLSFPRSLNDPHTVDLILHNPNENCVLAFKISMARHNDFLVEPEFGTIDAGSKCTVRITRKAGKGSQRNDKAVLTYTQLPQGSREVTVMTFENKSFCKEKELVIKRQLF